MLDNENEQVDEIYGENEIEDDFGWTDKDFDGEGYTDNAETYTGENAPNPEGIDEMLPIEHGEVSSMRRKRNSAPKKWIKPLVISISAILLVVIGFFGYALATVKDDRVMNNVYIGGVYVGGMTYEETLDAINAASLFENTDIVLTDGETEFTISGADVGLAALPEETAQKAMNYCKNDNIFVKAYRAGMLIFTPHEIVPVPETDEVMLGAKLDECGILMKGERKEHYIEFNTDQIATVFSGQTGYNGDHTKAHEQVVNALNGERFKNVRVDFETSPPEPMTIERIDAMIYKDPVNAEYVIEGNTVTITDGATGRFIDKEAVAQMLGEIYEGCEPVNIPYNISPPDVSHETLRAKLFANTLASYSTSYGGSTWNRCQNVARAASLINGTVIAPGAVFSFNDTVGHRTVENGFYTAKEYVNGESVDGIGGGTCQVSSTLYSAVLYADMGIVERLNHMMTVGYIPLGQDATVADGGVDFRFRNTTEYPIKIAASTNGSTITISIIGTAWDPPRTVKISNESSMKGANTVVRSTRYVYINGELVSTDTLNSSTYMPHSTEAVSTSAETTSETKVESESHTDSDDEYGENQAGAESSNDESDGEE